MNAMRIKVHAPVDHVNITLLNVSLDDINALLQVLDADRNHEARRLLYDELRRARNLLGGERVSTSENATPVPAGNPNTCRYCGEVIFGVNDGWRHAMGPKAHTASPRNVVHLEFGGPVKP